MGTYRTKVLLVEDESLIAELVSEVLEDHGFDVCAVASGEAGLARLQADVGIDVLFTDINLAGDMDGAELARQARALRPELPVVYASGRHTAATIAPMVSQALFLSKPYRPEDVCTLLRGLTLH